MSIGRSARFRATGLLFVGGAVAFIASFLPLGQIAFPAVADEPAATFVEIPGQTLALMVQTPYRLSIEGCLLFAGFWAAPLLLAAIGVALLVRRRPVRARIWVFGLLLILLGAGITVLYCALYLLFPRGEVIHPKATLDYGPAVVLTGYLLALVGVIWLALQRSRRARVEAGPPRQ
ncbi:MAG TPA: hypothetical protein VFW76_05615 [Ktedonobacterales bacterium]|nr:hypothetical protein [Ktedonobacterales bacterium]